MRGAEIGNGCSITSVLRLILGMPLGRTSSCGFRRRKGRVVRIERLRPVGCCRCGRPCGLWRLNGWDLWYRDRGRLGQLCISWKALGRDRRRCNGVVRRPVWIVRRPALHHRVRRVECAVCVLGYVGGLLHMMRLLDRRRIVGRFVRCILVILTNGRLWCIRVVCTVR